MTVIDIMPSVEVAAPAVTPAPFGLFSLGLQVPPADLGWQSGVWWRANGCNAVGVTYGVCTVDDVVPDLDPNVTCGIETAGAFTVYARSDESMGGMPISERRARARDVLMAGEQHAVEVGLWALLMAAAPTPAVTPASDPHDAIARAEGLIRNVYSGVPVLHMSPYTATVAGWNALRVEGDRLVTFLGSRAVAGSGYGIPSPTGADVLTVFATGNVLVVRGEINTVGEVYNQATNQIDELVERTYVVGWDCTAVRVEVP